MNAIEISVIIAANDADIEMQVWHPKNRIDFCAIEFGWLT